MSMPVSQTASTMPMADSRPTEVVRLGGAKGGWFRRVGWSHLIGVLALIFSLFPILFVVSASLNPLGTLSSSTLAPTAISGDAESAYTTTPLTVPAGLLVAGTNTVAVEVSRRTAAGDSLLGQCERLSRLAGSGAPSTTIFGC